MSEWERGSWMQTFTGRMFYPLAAEPGDIDPVDVAHALSQMCRYGGHTRRFYSVAEHSVLVSRWLEDAIGGTLGRAEAVRGLLHDAAEAYVGDMVRPLKHHMPQYREVEDRLLGVVAERFGVEGGVYSPAVKEADNRILLDERAELLTAPPQAWGQDDLTPLGVQVVGLYPPAAERLFLDRLAELGVA